MAYTWQTLSRGIAARLLGSQPAQPDGQDQAIRLSRWGDAFVESVFQKQHALADEESTFATIGTTGTGVATIAALTAIADTSPFIIIKNIAVAGAGGTQRVYLDLLKLITTAAGTGGTALRYGIKIGPNRADPTGMDVAFNPTLASPTGVPSNVTAASQRGSIARVYAGALVAPAALGGTRQIWGGQIKAAIPAAGDQYIFCFGMVDAPAQATQLDRCENCPSIVLDPGYSAFIHPFLPSQSAASSYEINLVHHER